MKAVLLSLPALAACANYAEHRAALVPHNTPIAGDGQPLQSTAQLSVGATSIADFRAPTSTDPDAGIAVPSTQLRGEIAIRASQNLTIGLLHERGLASTSTPLTSTQPPIGDSDVTGYGAIFAYSIPTSTPGFRVGLATELVMWSAPWVQYTTCIQNCYMGQGYTTDAHGTDMVPTLALGVTPSYRTGRWTLFGGVTARNQPTLIEKVETIDPAPPEVQAGSFNLVLHAGAEVELAKGVKASVFFHRAVTADPVSYGPSVGAMLAIPLGRSEPAPDRSPI